MTVRELIETLEDLPMDMPVVENGYEITEISIQEEMYFSAEHNYEEGQIVKVY